MIWLNDNDPAAAAWLRELVAWGDLPAGVVDERPIQNIAPADLAGVRQAHFFAGIGGWPLALELAGVPPEAEVWTGSCPCQPFSVAGRRQGEKDERHLWPEWRRLIAERRPAAVIGEQVESKAGRAWLAAVRADLEVLGYAVGAADLCAAGVGAPHIRQRLFFGAIRLAHHHDDGCEGKPGLRLRRSGVHDADGRGARFDAWSAVEWLPCRDGKWRPVEPGTFPLAHGLPARVGRLRGYGNAIVPQVAAAFVEEFFGALAAPGVRLR